MLTIRALFSVHRIAKVSPKRNEDVRLFVAIAVATVAISALGDGVYSTDDSTWTSCHNVTTRHDREFHVDWGRIWVLSVEWKAERVEWRMTRAKMGTVMRWCVQDEEWTRRMGGLKCSWGIVYTTSSVNNRHFSYFYFKQLQVELYTTVDTVMYVLEYWPA